jgi:hypothetical protein
MSDIGVLEIFRTRVFWNSWNNILSYNEKGDANDGRGAMNGGEWDLDGNGMAYS